MNLPFFKCRCNYLLTFCFVLLRLSKEAREILDTGRLKTVCREETDDAALVATMPAALATTRTTMTASAVDRERRRIARQKERRATLILGGFF